MFIIRAFFLILILAGGGLGIAYPWLARNHAGYEIGTWRVYDGSTFVPAQARPAPSETPLFLTVEMTTRGPLPADRTGAALTLAASSGGRTVLARALDFSGADGRTVNPQTGEIAYKQMAGRVDSVADDGLHITVARGDHDRFELTRVNVTVEAGAIDVQPNAIPIGYALLGVGFVGFIASFRRAAPKNPNSSPPPPPRWGRQ